MLIEINAKQNEAGIFRRWFRDDYFDLIVWEEIESSKLIGFQLCYDIGNDERCITWTDDAGFSHNSVDAGEDAYKNKKTPVLTAGGTVPKESVIDSFKERSIHIEARIKEYVIGKLESL